MQPGDFGSHVSVDFKTISLFGCEHLIGLGLIGLLIGLFVVFKNRFSSLQRRRIRYGMAGLLWLNEILFHIIKIALGQWSVQIALPLQLCSILVYLSAWTLITKDRRIFEPVYYLGLMGASQALLTPEAPGQKYIGLQFFQSMCSHGLIVLAVGFLFVVEQLRLPKRFPFYIFYFGAVYMMLVGGLNWLIDSNYLMLCQKPDFPTLLDYLPGWPWYVLWMYLVAGLLIWVIFIMTPHKR